MRPQDCRTGALDPNTRVCMQAGPGAVVANPNDCMSGVVDGGMNCLCVPTGETHRNPAACCSGMHVPGTNVCQCIPFGRNLHHGARGFHCCSTIQHGGKCSCQEPGGPIGKGRIHFGCCARTGLEHDEHDHCGCLKPGANVTLERSTFCCGGFYNHRAGTCGCIPNGYLVAGFVTADSCCSGNLERDEHGGLHCAGGSTTTTTTEPEVVEPPYQNITGVYTVMQVEGGNYLDAYIGREQFRVVTRPKSNQDSQKWRFDLLANSGFDGTSGIYTIKQVGSGGRSMDAYEDGADYTVVTREGFHDTHNHDTQRWIVTSTSDEGVYTIQQRSTHRYLDGYTSGRDNDVVTRPFYQHHNSQKWKLEKV